MDKRTDQIRLRLSDREKKVIEEAAKLNATPPSVWGRAMLIKVATDEIIAHRKKMADAERIRS